VCSFDLNVDFLEHVIEDFKKDLDVVLEAVANSSYAYKHADESLRKNKHFVINCINVFRERIPDLHYSIVNDREIQKVILNNRFW